ncbi:MAG: ribonuclease [Candidatus Saccharibacteria bacterium]|nr:ribonuclease [Candidatus Saccharibacteria bacterium]
MISTKHRFHGHNSLRFVYQKGQTVRAGVGSLKYTLNTRRNSYRLAVVVSKKVSKSAVQRNRIRRRIYEAVRLQEAAITKPYDLVITVFQDNVTTMPSEKLRQDVTYLLRQAKISS